MSIPEKNITGWLHWLSTHMCRTRSWNASSVGEQALVLCLGGELDTGLVLPGISQMTTLLCLPRPMRCTGDFSTAW